METRDSNNFQAFYYTILYTKTDSLLKQQHLAFQKVIKITLFCMF